MSENNSGVTPFSILKSALSAMIGVQSNENRERDFKSGKFWHFFFAGFIVLVAFMVVVWLAVKLLMASV
jgi:hypothetical protein